MKETEWETLDITDEEIAEQLDSREDAWKAGRGDSPYSQEYYEELYGLKKGKCKRVRSNQESRV